MTKNPYPITRLIGDPEENFFQLGLADKSTYHEGLKAIEMLLSTQSHWLNKILNSLLEPIGQWTLKTSPQYEKLLKAYSEGLEVQPQYLTRAYLVPELISGLHRWLPTNMNLMGCSSFFYLAPDSRPHHIRVLDFPLIGSFDKHQRLIQYNLKGMPQILSMTTSGFCLPGLTSMSDRGMSFALHQKFTPELNLRGTPIFDLVLEILTECKTADQVLKIVQKRKTVTTWMLNFIFEQGEVLQIDRSPNDIRTRRFHLKPGEIHYCNNQLINPENSQAMTLPYGIAPYNQMREEVAQEKIAKLKSFEPTHVLATMATPLLKKTSPQSWRMDNITPSSLHIIDMQPSEGQFLFPKGPSPQYFRGDLIQVKQAWKNPKLNVLKLPAQENKKTPSWYDLGMRSMIRAQCAFDSGDFELAYHLQQMGISTMKTECEKNIGQFYFDIYQYLNEDHEKIRANLKLNFDQHQLSLPPYLAEHAALFSKRLGRLLNDKAQLNSPLKNPGLIKVDQFEQKLNIKLLYKIQQKLLTPRFDILDVIYPYVK